MQAKDGWRREVPGGRNWAGVSGPPSGPDQDQGEGWDWDAA